MSVRFVLGRAGTGKTTHCLQQIRNRLAEDPADGHRLIFIVPEQASFQSERALLTREVPGFHRCEVLSFQRLAYRILSDRGPALPVLSGYGRTMVLRHLLEKHQTDLQLYTRAMHSPGLSARLAAALVELIEQNVTPEQLVSDGDPKDADPYHAAKLHDIGLIYGAYRDYLAGARLDPAQYLSQAAEQLDHFFGFDGAELWVDGFAGFTGQEIGLLVKLMQRARHTDVCLLIDPRTGDRFDATGQTDPFDVFAPPVRTLSALQSAIAAAGLALDPPLTLDPQPPHRYRGNADLARLEKNIFVSGARTSDTVATSAEHIQLIEADDRRTEIAAAIAKIRRLVSREKEPLRYRDVAIIVRDLSVYQDLLAAELDAQGLPYFVDRRRSVSHHAWVELHRALVAAPAEGFSLESIRLLLKTGLLPIDDDDADELENYLIGHGIDSAEAWFGPAWRYRRNLSAAIDRNGIRSEDQDELDRIDGLRNKFWQPLETWFALAWEDQPRTVIDWVGGLRAAIERIDADNRLDGWIQGALDDGALTLAEEHRLIRDHVAGILDDLSGALGAEQVDGREFSALLDQGLADLSVALTPPTIDQILVGSVERSRHPNLRAVFVLGFNESMFPLSTSEDAVLNDDDRARLTERGLALRPTRKQRLADERLLAYIALSRPSEYLCISYALRDPTGQALRPSPFVNDLRTALPGLTAIAVHSPMDQREFWAMHTADDVAEHLTLECSSRPGSDHDDRDRRAAWNDLYSRAAGDVTMNDRLRRSLSSLIYDNAAHLASDWVDSLYTLPLKTSVSRLERFNECAFRHFVKYGLKLEERATAELEVSDMGTLMHKVLEDFFSQLADEGRRLAGLADEDLGDRLDSLFDQYAGDLAAELGPDHPRQQFQIEQNRRLLLDSLRVQRQFSKANEFGPFATELHFGLKAKHSIGALEVKTPSGQVVALRGMIDRLDVLAREDDTLAMVIDYKRSINRTLPLDRVYHGLSLQLISYMLALRSASAAPTGTELTPVAALYVSLRHHHKPLPGAPAEALTDEQLAKRFKPRGIINLDHLHDVDATLGAGQSNVISAYLKKDGTVGHAGGSDLIPGPAFEALLDHVRRSLGRSAGRILDGEVEVKPYRLGTESPCTHCEFRSCCRFEYDPGRVRQLVHIPRQGVMDLLLGERSGVSDA
jgi:ATP-dependent helicase/nuclease subunit B